MSFTVFRLSAKNRRRTMRALTSTATVPKYILAKEIIYGNFFSVQRHNILQKSVNIVYYIIYQFFVNYCVFVMLYIMYKYDNIASTISNIGSF